jgi:hypothetical protein
VIWRRIRDLLDVQITRGDALVITVLLVIADWRWTCCEPRGAARPRGLGLMPRSGTCYPWDRGAAALEFGEPDQSPALGRLGRPAPFRKAMMSTEETRLVTK